MHTCSVTSVTPWAVVHQAPLSKGFSRQEYQSRLPFPSLEDLPNPGIKPASPVSPALAGGCFTTESSISKRFLTLQSSFAPMQRQDSPTYTFRPPEGSAGSLSRSKHVFICKGKKNGGRGVRWAQRSILGNLLLQIPFCVLILRENTRNVPFLSRIQMTAKYTVSSKENRIIENNVITEN